MLFSDQRDLARQQQRLVAASRQQHQKINDPDREGVRANSLMPFVGLAALAFFGKRFAESSLRELGTKAGEEWVGRKLVNSIEQEALSVERTAAAGTDSMASAPARVLSEPSTPAAEPAPAMTVPPQAPEPPPPQAPEPPPPQAPEPPPPPAPEPVPEPAPEPVPPPLPAAASPEAPSGLRTGNLQKPLEEMSDAELRSLLQNRVDKKESIRAGSGVTGPNGSDKRNMLNAIDDDISAIKQTMSGRKPSPPPPAPTTAEAPAHPRSASERFSEPPPKPQGYAPEPDLAEAQLWQERNQAANQRADELHTLLYEQGEKPGSLVRRAGLDDDTWTTANRQLRELESEVSATHERFFRYSEPRRHQDTPRYDSTPIRTRAKVYSQEQLDAIDRMIADVRGRLK